MIKPITIPNTFALQTGNVPASQLDADFSVLGNAINDLGTYADFSTDTGVANAYIVNYPAGVTLTLANGVRASFIPLNSNTGISTLNVAGTGAINLVRPDGSGLELWDIVTGFIYQVEYNSTLASWVLIHKTVITIHNTSPGSIEFSGGGVKLILQTGVGGTNGSGTQAVNFDKVFPNKLLSFVATTEGGAGNVVISPDTTIPANGPISSINVSGYVAATSVRTTFAYTYIAIGF